MNTAPSAAAAQKRPNLLLRLATAAVGLPAVAALVWLGGWPFAIAIGVVAFVAATEFVHGWLTPSIPIREALGRSMAPIAVALMAAGSHLSTRYLILGLAGAAIMGAIGFSQAKAFGPRRPFRIQAWCLVYVGVPLGAAVLVRDGWQGREWLFLGILATFTVDTAAYATGRLVGRHKLVPAISPAKTWEGAIGGYVAGSGAVLALNALLETGTSLVAILPVAIVLPIATQAGDLLESWMKRRMGVKDASGLLPGHGGLLDRLDSLFPAVIILWVFLETRVW